MMRFTAILYMINFVRLGQLVVEVFITLSM